MGYPRNFLWPEAAFKRGDRSPVWIYEITTRAVDGQHLWAPDDPELIELSWGVIGRALTLYPTVDFYGVHFLSNHFGLLAGFEDQATMEAFKRHVNSNLARECNHVRDRTGPVVGRRARAILIDSPQMLLDRLKYQLQNGTAENLVSRPDLWPGVHCARPLLEGTTPKGRWISRGPFFKAKLKNKQTKIADFTHWYDVPFAKIPTHSHLTDREYSQVVRGLCNEIIAERKEKHGNAAALGVKILTKPGAWRKRTPLKLRRPREASGSERPSTLKPKTNAPVIHTSEPHRLKAFRAAYKLFVQALRAERCRLAETFAELFNELAAPYRLSNIAALDPP